jgi:PAS domain S-box-containing protein
MPTQKSKPSDKSLSEFVSEVQPNADEVAIIEHERMVSLINSMADGVLATDEQGVVVLYNGAALNVLDLNVGLQGKKIDEVCEIVDEYNKPISITDYILDVHTQISTRDHKIKYSDGSLSNLYISVAPVRLGFGKRGSKGFVVLLRDITREKSLEEERDEFISVVSHELRTPVAIAEGNVSNAEFIIEKSGENSQIKEALKQAHDQILFLSGMINDLATLSRAERGVLKVEVESINTYDLVTELAKIYGIDAKKKNIDIKTNLDPHLELLKSSRLYVREILQNFITNAIKYTQAGSITIGAKQQKDGVLFEVIDTGIGISKGDQERVFDKFFRSEDYRTRENNGTGLGLYVTMKLARLIHAKIDLESELDKGSTFNIFVPSIQGDD